MPLKLKKICHTGWRLLPTFLTNVVRWSRWMCGPTWQRELVFLPRTATLELTATSRYSSFVDIFPTNWLCFCSKTVWYGIGSIIMFRVILDPDPQHPSSVRYRYSNKSCNVWNKKGCFQSMMNIFLISMKTSKLYKKPSAFQLMKTSNFVIYLFCTSVLPSRFGIRNIM